MSQPGKAVFTLGEIRAFRYLAIVQGIVACSVAVLADAPFFALAFTTAVMVAVPLLVYAVRRLHGKASAKSKNPGPKSGGN